MNLPKGAAVSGVSAAVFYTYPNIPLDKDTLEILVPSRTKFPLQHNRIKQASSSIEKDALLNAVKGSQGRVIPLSHLILILLNSDSSNDVTWAYNLVKADPKSVNKVIKLNDLFHVLEPEDLDAALYIATYG